MKRVFIIAALLYTINLSAQEGKLLDRSFWSRHPDLQSVQTEIKNESFNFKNVKAGDDPLSLAISSDASIEVIRFLAAQPNVDLQRGIHEGRTYLHAASAKGNSEAVDCLIKQGADIYYTDVHDQTALTYTAFMGKVTLPVLKAFIENGLDIHKKYETKGGADIFLMAVAADKDLAITNYLTSNGVSLQSTDKEGNSAVNYAAKLGNVDIIKALIQKGVKYDNNALFFAAQGPFRSANSIEIFKYLVEELKLEQNATNKKGQNLLHFIVSKQNQDDIITYFFNKGIDINQVDVNGTTPFMGAANSKNAETVALLLPKLKDINAINKEGKSALTNAVQNGSGQVVRLLIKNGAKADIKDQQGNHLGYYLVESIKKPRGFHGTPKGGNNKSGGKQDEQVINDFKEKLTALQEAGLVLNTSLNEGNTLYHLAIEKNNLALLKALSDLNIDINAKNKEGLTVLHRAAMHATDPEIMQYLISIGADKTIKTSFDETAYDLASENEQLSGSDISIDFLK